MEGRVRGMFVLPIQSHDESFAILATVAIDWWDSPPSVSVLQDKQGNLRSCIVRAVLFDFLGYTDFSVKAVVESGGVTPEASHFEQKLRQEYKDVLEEAVSAVQIDPLLRGPFGIARIELKEGAKPIRRKCFRCSGEREAAMERFVDKLIKKGWIVPSHSDWATQAFLVPKPMDARKPLEKQWRLVLDYRYLNTQTKDDPFPLPLIEDLLHRQCRNRIWSIFDLEDGFHQMHLAPECQECTAFITPKGLYHWTVLPMGVKNGPAMFQRLIQWILRGIPHAIVYIDDVLSGTSGDQHCHRVQRDSTECYRLREPVRLSVLETLGLRQEDFCVDLFANVANATLRPFCSLEDSAFG